MINRVAEFGIKWRLVHPAAKTKYITFGENKRKHTENKSRRQWNMNNKPIEEVQHYVHVGFKLCSYGSSYERSKDMSNKGFAIYGNLIGCGLHDHGLSPLTSSHVWHRTVLPSMFICLRIVGRAA
jgi:hypothetical protein